MNIRCRHVGALHSVRRSVAKHVLLSIASHGLLLDSSARLHSQHSVQCTSHFLCVLRGKSLARQQLANLGDGGWGLSRQLNLPPLRFEHGSSQSSCVLSLVAHLR